MKKRIGFWFVFIWFFTACSTSKKDPTSFTIKFEDFQQAKKLMGKKYQFDSILNPRKILVKNDFLIVSSDGSKNLVHLIELNNLSYLQSKGVKGQGPGEIKSMIWELDRGISEESFWA